MKKPPFLIAGNWKMVGSIASVETLLSGLKQGVVALPPQLCEWLVFPPFVFLDQAKKQLFGTSIAWGAQNVCDQNEGAYTAEISPKMLLEFGCQYALVGHSERRQLYGETNALITARLKNGLTAGLKVILCVGETLSEREAKHSWAVVQQQLAAVDAIRDNPGALEKIVIAYEPVWAIGTGKVADPSDIQTMHAAIRAELAQKMGETTASKVQILYGGSVKPENAADILALPDVNGALVGGASLKAESFLEIGKSCNRLS